ncbi:endonuclease/exonuclease/phosphatase family protein [Planosporangium sp. 12N6]|uniref:endonuclease/exonuclease/phosphatase family protein n=1 Tax=Planosporangium spinosum TaxID=3402278 RepID=UPI003CF00273
MTPGSRGARLRLMSYNVHGLRDDVTALAAVVRAAEPDVVVLQEAPRRFRWRAKSAALAARFGLVVAGGGLPALGNLVLTSLRVRVHGERCVRYPLTPGRHLRGAVVVDCSVGGTRFAVAGSHLATDERERPVQAELLRRVIARVGAPLLLGIDVNETPDGGAWRTLTGSRLVDAAAATGQADRATFPVGAPDRRIDAVLVDARCEIVDYRVFDPPPARLASDHFPLLVDVALP